MLIGASVSEPPPLSFDSAIFLYIYIYIRSRVYFLRNVEFEIELNVLQSHSNRGTHVFNNYGPVNSRGLLQSRQKRERPVFNNCGAVNSRGLLQSRQKRERPVFNNCGAVNSRGLLQSRQKRERPVFNNCGAVNSRGLLQSRQPQLFRFTSLLFFWSYCYKYIIFRTPTKVNVQEISLTLAPQCFSISLV